MARKSLRPQLNQIRAWVRQGRTDAWVAHQLEVTVQEIEQFKRQNELAGGEEPAEGLAATDFREEIDLRAEDDALIAAELEAAAQEAERERAEAEATPSANARHGLTGYEERGDEDDEERPRPPSRPSRRTRPALPGPRQRPARGHLRPRRGGLRPVARPRRPGQPDLRRALGRPPPDRGPRRGGPDQSSAASATTTRARLAERAAAARVVGGLAQVAREGGVDDDARVPRPRVVGGGVHRQLQAPRGAASVELDELLRPRTCHRGAGAARRRAPPSHAPAAAARSGGACPRRRSPWRHW